jgi:hypothetical protein
MKLEKLIIPVFCGIVIYAILRMFFYSRRSTKEAFGFSDGTLIQLSTSHVPTAEDMAGLRAQKRQIDHDLIDMTGSA